ncbi:rhodanese-like domain-containing protein [Bermanella sp. R86510]|uniref:rhodanese-like domain-containing protein n=1 Tax=unclassified Bermanella TaxID=2627862 RepID=UPI0037C617D3
MEQFFEFVINHWMLVSALVVLLVLLMWDSGQKSGPKVSSHEATRLINQQNALVLDIRDKAEFGKGHLVDALNIPQAQIANRLSELEKHKDVPIIVVCKSGQTASAASKTLKDNGFAQVYRLNGGIMDWQNNNLPLVKG